MNSENAGMNGASIVMWFAALAISSWYLLVLVWESTASSKSFSFDKISSFSESLIKPFFIAASASLKTFVFFCILTVVV